MLLLGEPGSGKSDLALRLIDSGAKLVADDQVALSETAGKLHAQSPASIAGMLEVRGVGIITLPAVNAPVALVVRLVARDEVDRLPEPAFFDCLNVAVPLLSLHAFDESTPAKIRLMVSKETA